MQLMHTVTPSSSLLP